MQVPTVRLAPLLLLLARSGVYIHMLLLHEYTNLYICDIFFLRSYCLISSPIPTPCPAGTYGSVTGLQTAACSGLCDVGSYCLANSTIATPCPPGTYGFMRGLQTAACSGLCSAGSFCPLGSTATTTCPIAYVVHYTPFLFKLHIFFLC